jgi:hypothetical protein
MNMNSVIERLLTGRTTCSAPPELRSRVLQAVAVELTLVPASRPWLSRGDVWTGLTVAAALLIGVLVNVWAVRSDEVRQARLCGERPLPREISAKIQIAESVAGPAGAELVRHQLLAAWHARRSARTWDIERYQQLIQQTFGIETRFLDVQEDSEVDDDRPGRDARSALDRQRHIRMA